MKNPPFKHEQRLELSNALHMRKTTWKMGTNLVTVTSERFLSMEDTRVAAMQYRVTVSEDTTIEIDTQVDIDIWDINGPHLTSIKREYEYPYDIVRARTQECDIPVSVATLVDTSIPVQDGLVFLQAKETLLLTKYILLQVENVQPERAQLQYLYHKGYDYVKTIHTNRWKDLWYRSDVTIEGDDEADFALRYSIYHLLILTPRRDTASIPARGVSSQVYKGAIFWDTEIFMLPFYLNTNPTAARHLIRFRYHGLEGAKKKAKTEGYDGAFYAWESHENGIEACTYFNVVDVFTKRPIRTYFRDKQIHISCDIAYALESYIKRTNDASVITEGGFEQLLEISRFLLSYLLYKPSTDTYVLHDVLGPDEYHERVNNNAFTNRMAYHTLRYTAQVLQNQKKNNPVKTNTLLENLDLVDIDQQIELVCSKWTHETLNPDNVIEQFDGYFQLEDIDINSLKQRLVNPQEYWGGSNGIASHTQIIKQADVVTMLSMFPSDFTDVIKNANFDYYEPRTEHGSSLSASMYALLACQIGEPDYAYHHFLKSATVDLTGDTKQFAGSIYIGGTHPAASGGAYMTAVHGFMGISFTEGGISVTPSLPKSIDRMSCRVWDKGTWYHITVTKDDADIKQE
jgi:trehalose/maltose hydrolase-like predicted phosphorylase